MVGKQSKCWFPTQVELTLNVEKLLPECLRRRWVVRGQTLTPNAISNPLLGFFKDERFTGIIAKRVILQESEDALSELHARQDDLMNRVKTLKSSVRVFMLPCRKSSPRSPSGEGDADRDGQNEQFAHCGRSQDRGHGG